jgi:peptide deformylase
MANYKVLLAIHPALKRIAEPVASVDADIKKLMKDMTRIMQEKKGVGLAATQIGVNKRVLTIDVRFVKKDKPNLFCMANPEILWASPEQETEKEYCFSIPEIGVPVKRPTEVKIRYLDEHNQTQELHATGLLARCFQHELDHLNGIVTLNYLSPLKRQLAIKKLQRLDRAQRLEEAAEQETATHHPL